MKNTFVKTISAAAFALFVSAVPASVFAADICDRISPRSHESIMSQVQRLLPNNETVSARDAACVLGKIRDTSTQENVGIYLGQRLRNPNNLDTMLSAVKDQKTRNAISRAVGSHRGNGHHNNQNNQNSQNIINVNGMMQNVCSAIVFDERRQQGRSVYVQVKDLVRGNSTILSDDVACIIKGQTNAQQQKITDYLLDKLEDPYNYDVIASVMNNVQQRNRFIQNVQSKYNRQQLQKPSNRPSNHGHNNAQTYPAHRPGTNGAPTWNHIPGMNNIPGMNQYPGANRPNHGTQYKVVSISNKIDYTFSSKIADQVRLYLGDNYIQCDDAAAILRKVSFGSTQAEILQVLAPRIIDPDNIHIVVAAAANANAKEEIVKTLISSIPTYQSGRRYSSTIAKNVAGKIDYTFGSKTLDQVILYLAGRKLYANDAAQILKKTAGTAQTDVGVYLVGYLYDPENIDLLMKAATFNSTKDAMMKAAMNRR